MAFARQALQTGFRIGDCLIQPDQNRINRGEITTHVEPRVMDVLLCLAEQAGEVVSREALHEAVWGRVVVTDQALTNCISELRRHLGDDGSGERLIETVPKRGYRLAAPVTAEERAATPPGSTVTAGRITHLRWPLVAGVLLAVVAVLGWVGWSPGRTSTAPGSVAVVTFDNAAAEESLEFLALALPDEVATLLSRSADLAVRPLSYLDPDAPLEDARDRQVGYLVSGRFYRESADRLTLAVEAQHVAEQRVVWRARVTAPAGDLRTLRERLTERIQRGLLPALGAGAARPVGPMPLDDEAYQLYLRSLALPKQPGPTERAIEMLERAVALDPGFAPAWEALGLRYYDHGTYGAGGEPARRQSLAANQRALEIDPEFTAAARQIIALQTEAGQLEAAYGYARRLLEGFGDNTAGHFALAYVYRFGGLLEPAQRHCELALARDPNDPQLRSCAYAYLYAGELSRVMTFLALDEGSYFVQWGTVLYHLRGGDDAAALEVARQAPTDPTRALMAPCLEGVRGAALDQPAQAFERYWQRHGDPEAPYAVAPMLAHCGYPDAALRLLESAVDGSFCSFPALDRDTIWAGLRDHPEFLRIRGKAMACHERFRRMVDAFPGDPEPL